MCEDTDPPTQPLPVVSSSLEPPSPGSESSLGHLGVWGHGGLPHSILIPAVDTDVCTEGGPHVTGGTEDVSIQAEADDSCPFMEE